MTRLRGGQRIRQPFAGEGTGIRPRAAGGGGGGTTALFSYVLRNEAGSTAITNFPTLRVSLNSGPWQTLTAAGLTIAQDVSGELLVSGAPLAGATVRFTIERNLPGEPFNAANSVDAIYAAATSGPNPVNPTLFGLPLSDTIFGTSVEAV